jgi:hypothetical protein
MKTDCATQAKQQNEILIHRITVFLFSFCNPTLEMSGIRSKCTSNTKKV